jgi:hypothetical protein
MGTISNSKRFVIEGFWEQLSSGCEITRTSATPQALSWTNSRTGGNNPNWRQAIADGNGATNALNGSKGEFDYKPGLWQFKSDKTKSWTDPCARANEYVCKSNSFDYIPSLPGIPSDTGYQNEAINNGLSGIHKQIHNETTKFSGMVMLGELRETVRLIKSPARAFRRETGIFADKADRLRRKKLPSHTKANAFAETYLEYAFAVSPMINDIQGIAEAYKHKASPGIKRLSFTGHSESTSHTKHVTTLRPSFNMNYMKLVHDKYQAIYTVGHQAEIVSNNSVDRIIDLGGFNLNEVIPTAWELVPWSFLADYFLNIGDMLSAATMSTVGVKWAQFTLRKQRDLKLYNFIVKDPPSWSLYHKPTTLKQPLVVSSQSSVSRQATTLTIPSLQFSLPGSTGQFLNMAALAKLNIFSK